MKRSYAIGLSLAAALGVSQAGAQELTGTLKNIRDTGAIEWQAVTNESALSQINASPVVVANLVLQGTASIQDAVGGTDGGIDMAHADASSDADGGAGGGIAGCTGPGGKCTDFPVEPIVETAVVGGDDVIEDAVHLSVFGLRQHIRNALAHGATKEDVLEVIELASLLGLHACTVGVPILVEEAAAVQTGAGATTTVAR